MQELTEEQMRRLRRVHADKLMHEATYKKFREIWLMKDEEIKDWGCIGERCVSIIFVSGEACVFTYYDKDHWKIEFKDHIIGYADCLYITPKLLIYKK
jgi:hypothetical protein